MFKHSAQPAPEIDYDQTTQATTTEWLVSVLRWVVILVFTFLRGPLSAPANQALYFFLLLGILYNLYASYLLYTGAVRRNLPHFLSFFLFTDILLLVALVYFSNIYESGLLIFYFFLIIMVALRSSFRLSLILGPIMGCAYLSTSYLITGPQLILDRRTVFDILGLLTLSVFCGWFAEGKSRAWQALYHLGLRLKAVSRDLEDTQRQLEVHRRLEQMRRDFLAMMSHELRTPLTGIIGYLDFILLEEAGPLGPQQRKYLQEAMERSEDLLRLISNLLDLSRVQSGRWHLQLKRFDLRALVEEILESHRLQAQKKGISLTHPTRTDAPLPALLADRDKVARVLTNLVGNALKFSAAGATIAVREEGGTDPSLAEHFPHLISSSEILTIAVVDSGPGIPPEDRPHIFERFYRGGAPNGETLPHGAGLGLAIAREIVELHWGRIWFEETPGGGSTFRFSLPMNPLRLEHKIALKMGTLVLEDLLDGLLLQFQGEIAEKHLTITRRGWPAAGRETHRIAADRQLLQCVLFNVLNNQIRYAFPGSEIVLTVAPDPHDRRLLIRSENHGDALEEKMVEHFRSRRPPEEGMNDLRQVGVNLDLARDIIESHGGTMTLENLKDRGVAVAVSVPLDEPPIRKGMSDGAKEGPDRR